MTKIILASQSPQRKKLLKLLELPFTVKPSGAQEISYIQTTVSKLVKDNALIKARDVASKVKEGLVIGSDTVVYTDGRLILKPKTLKEAKRELKRLMAKPHWVYSGVAVINAATGKECVAFDKTKVFMNTMSDKEIDKYYKRMSPLDKAGGFDIEGLGSSFIHRIEGCYFNVVGLPLATLTKMLKKMGVSVLSLLMCVMLTGCMSWNSSFNPATGKQETLMHDTDREVAIGSKVSVRVEEKYELLEHVEMQERIDTIMDRLVPVVNRQDLVYVARILDEDDINAVALPGGYIYAFRGLIEKVENDDQLAGVMAHEIAHITAKHSIKRMQLLYGTQLLLGAAIVSGEGQLARGVDVAATSALFQYSQEDEQEADRLGIKYMRAAGYDPQEMVKFLGTLQEESRKSGRRRYSVWRSHPQHGKRISAANSEATGELNFRDYLNLTEEKKW